MTKTTAATKKIEKLTPGQEARIPEFREAWLTHGLSTAGADRPRAEAGVRLAYEAAGLKEPEIFIWLDSPMAGAWGASLLAGGSKFGAQVWAQVRDQVGDQVSRAVYGQHDAGWLGYLEYFGRVTGLGCVNRTHGLMEVAQSCGWWWPFERAVILTERPAEIHRDDANRLHGEKKPALLYRDGFAIWAWHGVRVPEDWIMGKPPAAAEALKWPNMEQRRAACELVGWNNILRELKAKTIQKDKDPEVGELVEVDIPDIGRERFLRVRCGTGREFAIPVPPKMKTALEANSWTYGISPEEYRPEVRT